MTTLTYLFDNVKYILEDAPSNQAILTVEWNYNHPRHKLWAMFTFQRDGSSTVTTAYVPRLFNAFTIAWKQNQYASIIRAGKGPSTFKVLQDHFASLRIHAYLTQT